MKGFSNVKTLKATAVIVMIAGLAVSAQAQAVQSLLTSPQTAGTMIPLMASVAFMVARKRA
jgi:ACR3 family arsenite efflux pump ArsB